MNDTTATKYQIEYRDGTKNREITAHEILMEGTVLTFDDARGERVALIPIELVRVVFKKGCSAELPDVEIRLPASPQEILETNSGGGIGTGHKPF